MKINKFDVASELEISADGWQLTGWFETPAAPNVRYTIDVNLNELFQIAEDSGDCLLYRDDSGLCTMCDTPLVVDAQKELGSDEQVQMPDNTVAEPDPPTEPLPEPASEQVQMPDGKVEDVKTDPEKGAVDLGHGAA